MNDKNNILNILKSKKEKIPCFPIRNNIFKIVNLNKIKHSDSTIVYLVIGNKKPRRVYNIKNYMMLNKRCNYLILIPLTNYKSEKVFKMFYWIGKHNSIKNNVNLCYFTTILSYELNIQKMYRETYRHESDEFKNLFKKL